MRGGDCDSRAEAIAYLHFLGAGFEVEENLRAYVDNAADALLYFERLGLKFQLVRNVPDIYYGMAPGAKAEGRMVEFSSSPATNSARGARRCWSRPSP